MDFIYSITPDGWISFIGSILGFIGVIITIRYTKKQFEIDKRISIKPYLNMELSSDYRHSGGHLGIFEINRLKNSKLYEDTTLVMNFQNLGQGNCLECELVKIMVDNKNIDDECSEYEYGYMGSIKVDSNKIMEIIFTIFYEDILDSLKKKYVGKNINDCPKISSNFKYLHPFKNIELQFEYKDILDNKYRKKIVMETSLIFNIYNEKYIWEISDIKFNDILYQLNDNLTTEKLVK